MPDITTTTHTPDVIALQFVNAAASDIDADPARGYIACAQSQETGATCHFPAIGVIRHPAGYGDRPDRPVCAGCAMWCLGIGGDWLKTTFHPFGVWPTHDDVLIGVAAEQATSADHVIARPALVVCDETGAPTYKIDCAGCDWGSIWHPTDAAARSEHSAHRYETARRAGAEAMLRTV